MYLSMLLFACTEMSNAGHPFSQVTVVESTGTTATAEEVVEAFVDPAFADPQEDIIVMGGGDETPEEEPVEEPAEEPQPDEAPVPEEAPPIAAGPVQTVPAFIQQGQPARRPARVTDGWMPTLVATLTSSPVPRAVLAMPSGEEIVVRAGDLLAEEGVIVMSIGVSQVELASISAEGGCSSSVGRCSRLLLGSFPRCG
jgi:hypothetical protein